MIYTEVPLKYRFVPNNINLEIFRITTCAFIFKYLKVAEDHWLDLVISDKITDGHRLRLADDLKDLHKITSVMRPFVKKLNKDIWGVDVINKYYRNIDLLNCEFDYTNLSPPNTALAVKNLRTIQEYYNYNWE